MKKKIGFFLLWAACAASPLSAQLSADIHPYRHFELAQELYGKQLYGAAFAEYERFLDTKNSSETQKSNDLYLQAELMQAICAYYNERDNASILLYEFAQNHAESSLYPLAQYYLGKMYFAYAEYTQAVEAYSASQSVPDLDVSAQDERDFQTGYAYFALAAEDTTQEMLQKADSYFAKLAQSPRTYQEKSLYYHALISYQLGNYEEAVSAMRQVEKVKSYQADAQPIIANSLQRQGKNKELYAYIEELKAQPEVKTDREIVYLAANTAYEEKVYDKSARYFGMYQADGGEFDRIANARYGYALYQEKEYDKAVLVLQNVRSESDSLTQFASYYQGFSYIHQYNEAKGKNEKLAQDKLEAAKDAFILAFSGENGDDAVREDALWQYIKATYDVGDYGNSADKINLYLKDYPNGTHAKELKGMRAEILYQKQDYTEVLNYLDKENAKTKREKSIYQNACLQEGLNYYRKGDYSKAESWLEKAKKESEHPDVAHSAAFWIAESKFQQEKYDLATAAYTDYQKRKDVQKHDLYPLSDYGLGWCYFKEKKYSSAADNFNQFLAAKSSADYPSQKQDAALRSGDCYFMKKDYASASTQYNKALEMNGSDQDYALYQMGESNYRRQQYDASILKFDKLVSAYPTSERVDDALNRIADIYLTWKNNPKKSQEYSQKLIKQYPRSPYAASAYNRLALGEYEAGNTQTAITYFKKVLDDYSLDIENCRIALDNLGTILPADQYAQVLAAYKLQNPNAGKEVNALTLKTAEEQYFAGNYNTAADLFTHYLAEVKGGESYYEALLYRGQCYVQKNEAEKALNDFEKVYTAKSNPFIIRALDAAAKLQESRNQYTEGLALYQKISEVSEKAENKILAHFGEARCAMRLKKYSDATAALAFIATHKEATDEQKLSSALMQAHCLYESNRKEEAMTLCTEIASQHNDDSGSEAKYLMTQILFDQAKYPECKEMAKDLRKNFPDSEWKARAYLVVAEANVKQDNAFQAKAVLESLLQDDRYPDVQDKARKRLAELNADEKKAAAQKTEEDKKVEAPKAPEPPKPNPPKNNPPKKSDKPKKGK